MNVKQALANRGYTFAAYDFRNAEGKSLCVSFSAKSESAYLENNGKKLRVSNHPRFNNGIELERVNTSVEKDVHYDEIESAISWLLS